MSDSEQPAFDVTQKKKKKSVSFVDEAPAVQEEAAEPVADDAAAMFSGLKKKKSSKKSKKQDSGEAEAAEEQPIDEDMEQLKIEGEQGDDETAAAGDVTEMFGKKKKKKKRQSREDAAEEREEEVPLVESEDAWQTTDRDYTYHELLGRVFKLIRQNNPSLAGERQKFIMVPPQVARDGSKKSVFINIADICRRMNRPMDHLIAFIYAELGTQGSVDGSSRLIIKGRFQQPQIESVLRRYILEYVQCKTCKSPDTAMHKENRLMFVQCEACGSRRTVAAIKSGFLAQTTKRRLAKP